MVTPTGFFVKFQGASALCLLRKLCLLLHLFPSRGLIWLLESPPSEADEVLAMLCPTLLRQSYLPKLFEERWKKK